MAKIKGKKTVVQFTVIHFQDHGQDFLRWTLDQNGKVVCSQPFQTSIWRGCVVINPKGIRPGGKVHFIGHGAPELQVIKYPVKEVYHG